MAEPTITPTAPHQPRRVDPRRVRRPSKVTTTRTESGYERGHSGGQVKKNLEDIVTEEAEKHPERPVEVFASDEHRLG